MCWFPGLQIWNDNFRGINWLLSLIEWFYDLFIYYYFFKCYSKTTNFSTISTWSASVQQLWHIQIGEIHNSSCILNPRLVYVMLLESKLVLIIAYILATAINFLWTWKIFSLANVLHDTDVSLVQTAWPHNDSAVLTLKLSSSF